MSNISTLFKILDMLASLEGYSVLIRFGVGVVAGDIFLYNISIQFSCGFSSAESKSLQNRTQPEFSPRHQMESTPNPPRIPRTVPDTTPTLPRKHPDNLSKWVLSSTLERTHSDKFGVRTGPRQETDNSDTTSTPNR